MAESRPVWAWSSTIAADHAGVEELLGTLKLCLGELHVGQLGGARGFLAADSGFLLERINLHDGRAGFHDVARFHEDFGDLTVHLGIQVDGAPGFERADVFGAIGNLGRAQNNRLDGRRPAAAGRLPVERQRAVPRDRMRWR